MMTGDGLDGGDDDDDYYYYCYYLIELQKGF
jgi:hypothetical protein